MVRNCSVHHCSRRLAIDGRSTVVHGKLHVSTPSHSEYHSPSIGSDEDYIDNLRHQQFEAVAGAEDSIVPATPLEKTILMGSVDFCIVLSAITMGIEMELHESSSLKVGNFFYSLEIIFAVVFGVEFLVKFTHQRCGYFSNQWHWLDFGIVVASILDVVLRSAYESNSQFKTLKILRSMRLLRALRLRAELVSLTQGILNSLRCIIWVFVLLIIFIYVAALFFRVVIGDADYGDLEVDPPYWNRDLYFGTFLRTMLTLLNVSLMDEWGTIIRPVSEEQVWLVPLLIVFLVVTAFSLVNAIVGLVVQNTVTAGREMEEKQDLILKEHKLHFADQLIQLMRSLDQDRDCKVSLEELARFDDDPDNAACVKELFTEIGLPTGFSMQDLHIMLDFDGDEALSTFEFFTGIKQLVGATRFQKLSLKIHSIVMARKCVMRDVSSLQDLNENTRAARLQVDEIRKYLQLTRPNIPPPSGLMMPEMFSKARQAAGIIHYMCAAKKASSRIALKSVAFKRKKDIEPKKKMVQPRRCSLLVPAEKIAQDNANVRRKIKNKFYKTETNNMSTFGSFMTDSPNESHDLEKE